MKKTKTVSATAETFAPPTTAAAIIRVPFHDHEIQATQDDAGYWLPLRPMCEYFDVRMEGQLAKLKTCEWATLKEIFMVAEDGKVRMMVCLHLRSLAAWLLSIKPGKVKAAVREMLACYQREAADVLYRHFFGSDQPRAKSLPAESEALTAIMDRLAQLDSKISAVVTGQERSDADVAAIKTEVSAFHREHSQAQAVAAIGDTTAKVSILKPILVASKEKAAYLGGKKFEPKYNRKFHMAVRKACGGFAGPWKNLPRNLLGNAETRIAEILSEVRSDARAVEEHGYTPQQLEIFRDKPRSKGKASTAN